MYDTNPEAEWNQNILRNLKYKFNWLNGLVPDSIILARFYEWTAEMCLSENDPDFVEYLRTGN